MIYEVGASAELSEKIPADVRQMVWMVETTEQGYEEQASWGKAFGLVVQFRKKFGEPTLGMGVRDLSFGPAASRTVDVLNAFMVTIDRAHQFPGVHFGVAVLSEAIRVNREDLLSGDNMKDTVDDLVAIGKKQCRMGVGATCSGWQFSVGRDRGQPVEIVVAEPGEELPGALEILPLVVGVNERYTALG